MLEQNKVLVLTGLREGAFLGTDAPAKAERYVAVRKACAQLQLIPEDLTLL